MLMVKLWGMFIHVWLRNTITFLGFEAFWADMVGYFLDNGFYLTL